MSCGCSCGCSCDVPTPKWIYDNETVTVEIEGVETQVPRDVFSEIIDAGDDYADVMRQALWANYGYRGIGACPDPEPDANGNTNIDYWLQAMRFRYWQIRTVYQARFAVFADFLTRLQQDGPDYSIGSTKYDSITGDENNPQDPVADWDDPYSTTLYLDRRTWVRQNSKSFAGLDPETVAQYMDSIENIEKRFADEFREQFAWVM